MNYEVDSVKLEFVTVIIPVYRDWERLKICTNALSKQTYPQDKFEVIIVNNDPEDSPPDLSLPDNFRIISEGKPGSYAARNAGIKKAKGEILAFTDSDCIPESDWLKEGVMIIDNKSVFTVSGKTELFYKDEYNLSFTEAYEKYFSFSYQHNLEEISMVTANCFIHRNIFDQIGLFKDDRFSGGDTEFANRIKNNNYRIVYSPNVIIWHPARYYFEEISKKRKRIFGGKVKILMDKNNKNKNNVIVVLLYKCSIGQVKKIFSLFKYLDNTTMINVFKAQMVSLLLIGTYVKEALSLIAGKLSKRL